MIGTGPVMKKSGGPQITNLNAFLAQYSNPVSYGQQSSIQAGGPKSSLNSSEGAQSSGQGGAGSENYGHGHGHSHGHNHSHGHTLNHSHGHGHNHPVGSHGHGHPQNHTHAHGHVKGPAGGQGTIMYQNRDPNSHQGVMHHNYAMANKNNPNITQSPVTSHAMVANKLNASEIQAVNVSFGEDFKITSREHGIISAKIYYAKKQFLWEFLDDDSGMTASQVAAAGQHKPKRKVEVKFADVVNIYVKNKQPGPSTLIIETSKEPRQYKDMQQASRKSIQWVQMENTTISPMKSTGKGQKVIKIITEFAKDHFTRRIQGKSSHFDKLMSCDPKIQALIERNSDPRFYDPPQPLVLQKNPSGDPYDRTREGGEEIQSATFTAEGHGTTVSLTRLASNNYAMPGVSNALKTVGDRTSLPNGSNGYEGDKTVTTTKTTRELGSIEKTLSKFKNHLPEKKLSALSKAFKIKRNSAFSKVKNKCPFPSCKFRNLSSSNSIRTHFNKHHRHVLEMGLDMTPSGHYILKHTFMDKLLAYASRYQECVETAGKEAQKLLEEMPNPPS
eukprot:CAMPEP_0115016920 /NCGR_PEP_ID=MMETSP0216-20121206/27770_1 /TAXON_ID=223996 /ORGANISM="Protocruzia adherens, Strain Boccale" /LENGTH=556 /DNA_ID=CAMNT_0002387561 /DNA_START=168 /DNA_END=1838 /DNA_ORIENTATION=-